MEFKVYKKIREVKNLWESLYSKNKYLSGFQEYDWMELCEKRFLGRKPFKYIGWNLLYFVIENEFIAPLLVNRKLKKVQFLGTDSSSDYLSFVYNPEAVTKLNDYCNVLLEYFIGGGYLITLQRINQSNPLSIVLDSLVTKYHAKKESHVCVAIDLKNGEGTFFENCTKNARHCYSQAINRLSRDGHKLSVSFTYGVVDATLAHNLHNMYLKHRENCNARTGLDQNYLINFANKMRTIFIPSTSIDVLSEYSCKYPVWLAQLFIDDELAAFWEGNVNNSGDTVSMYRTAMNEKYYWYEPGTILMVNFIEHLRDKYRYFDLTRGGEEYKFRFGGKEHYNNLYLFGV